MEDVTISDSEISFQPMECEINVANTGIAHNNSDSSKDTNNTLQYKFTVGTKQNSVLLHTIQEQQLYKYRSKYKKKHIIAKKTCAKSRLCWMKMIYVLRKVNF